ncbi:MAG: type I-U CRISPR-associated protein Cas7 [Candidatus Eremiobacteraeota bacterium]|nr:type I-U CRISPR-associated protein Cas7 [Candidatus Eremiobacteraeota bacterium]MBC5802640.1 type I-U CRISPR-associated protein Cas7 [Candidatus Eremiobacteraeota bacterium]MBC5825117.1 type I-U CRISPR-associated protein Cas7 [Candidatus Eremiobacteraeota bacterium]
MTLEHEIIDAWADDLRGPVALHFRETLLPVEGRDAVIFPPTYAMGDRRDGAPYSIDKLANDKKVVQIDSVGSQANRMEPLFRRAPEGSPNNPLADLVPQVDIEVSADSTVSLFEVGHRLGDALVRSSSLQEEAKQAFEDFQLRGDATAIAKLAPTSLVFGAWDSRGEQAKFPRLVQSVIRAWDVDALRRSAQYNPAVDYAKLEVFSDEEKERAEGNTKSPLAQQGFVHVPAVDSHGGVVVHGDVRRDVTVNLVALRQLGAKDGGVSLRRYILGLALVAATEPQDGYLRQGCLLTPDPQETKEWTLVARTGARSKIAMHPSIALDYARSAAQQFGVGDDRRVTFERDRAKASVAKKDEKKKKG